MNREQRRQLARHFHENGLKVMLENPGNVHDALQILHVRAVPRIDFPRMTVEPVHFVERDYRHIESDIVLKAPMRVGRKGRARIITIYILIEHQSEPDRFMVVRGLDYLLQIYKRQMREWQQEHGSLDGFRLQPVLPIVLYTGTRTWERLERIAELVELDEELPEGMTPEFGPLFLNVGETSEESLEKRGGPFGLLLRLVQQRRLRRPVFEKTLEQVVRGLEDQIADADRDRWLDLLSYVYPLIYHERDEAEHDPLQRVVTDSVKNDKHRQEVFDMRQTIAEALMEEGAAREAVRSRREMLLRLLQRRFKRVPAGIMKRIENTTDIGQLDAWFDASATAKKLADVGIPPLE